MKSAEYYQQKKKHLSKRPIVFNGRQICKCGMTLKDHFSYTGDWKYQHYFIKKSESESLKVGSRVIERDHHGDTGTIKAIFPEEGSSKMYCKVQWDHGATADYFLDDMEPVLELGQQHINKMNPMGTDLGTIFKDDDKCKCGSLYKDHMVLDTEGNWKLKHKFRLKKDIAPITTTMSPATLA